MEKTNKKAQKKVLVALSGRVDSSVAAFLLKKQGFKVYALSIVNFDSDLVDESKFLPKCHIIDLDKIAKFCDEQEIPFYATDAKSIFDDLVIDKYVSQRLLGRANTTCYDCTNIRMNILFEKMKELKIDYIATGHYAKIQKNLNSERFYILSNSEMESDQSYLLSCLSQEILEHLILPLGELKKSDVQKIASSFDLNSLASTTQKGLCLPNVVAGRKIIENKVPKSLLKEGEVLNLLTGTNPTIHSGITNFFVSQKDPNFGTTMAIDKGLEIVGFDYHTNQILVGDEGYLTFKGFQISNLVVSEGIDCSKPSECYIRLKGMSEFYKGILYFKNNNSAYLDLKDELHPIINDEVVVIYNGNNRNSKIIGKGKIGHREDFYLIDRVAEYRKKDLDDDGKLIKSGDTKLFKF